MARPFPAPMLLKWLLYPSMSRHLSTSSQVSDNAIMELFIIVSSLTRSCSLPALLELHRSFTESDKNNNYKNLIQQNNYRCTTVNEMLQHQLLSSTFQSTRFQNKIQRYTFSFSWSRRTSFCDADFLVSCLFFYTFSSPLRRAKNNYMDHTTSLWLGLQTLFFSRISTTYIQFKENFQHILSNLGPR